MNIHTVYALFFRVFRKKRMEEFLRVFNVTPDSRILDVGGVVTTWAGLTLRPHVTMLNLSRERAGGSDLPCVVGDGRDLPFRDAAFDLVFSNSVIEHLGDIEGQRRFASEIARVGRSFYVQTPNRWFFIEPHLVTPFVHFLPKIWQRRMLRNFTIWGIITRPTAEQCHDFVKEVRLLTETEMQLLFPEARIQAEKVVGLTKSFLAVKLPSMYARLA